MGKHMTVGDTRDSMRPAFRPQRLLRKAEMVDLPHNPNPDSLPDELTTSQPCACGGAWGTVIMRFGDEAAVLECLYGHREYIECSAECTDGFLVTHSPVPSSCDSPPSTVAWVLE